MDRKILTLLTLLPARTVQVTLCRTCGDTDAYMRDMRTPLLAVPVVYEPLTESAVKYSCEQCRQAAKLKAQAEQWLLHPNFFKPDFSESLRLDPDVVKRKYRGYWMSAPVNYALIEKAALLIWYDNGMINRQEPEAEKLDMLRRWLFKLDQDKLAYIDNCLARLTESQLDTVCCGAEHEAEGLISHDVDAFLGKIFDEEYTHGLTRSKPSSF